MQARCWFAIAISLAAVDAALAAVLLAWKAPEGSTSPQSPIRVPSDEELSIWDRHDSKEFGLVTIGEWTRACRRLVDDIRTARATIDEAFQFTVGALQGIDWSSAGSDSSGSARTYALRTISGEKVGWVILQPERSYRKGILIMEVSCPGAFESAGDRATIRASVSPQCPILIDELQRDGGTSGIAGDIATFTFTQSIDSNAPDVRALRPGDELCTGGGFTWDLDGRLTSWRTAARVVSSGGEGVRFETRDVDWSTPNPGYLAEDGRSRIQMLLDRH